MNDTFVPPLPLNPRWTGFDDLMPLERGFPRFIPRFFGTKLKVIIGPSITSKVRPLLDSYHSSSITALNNDSDINAITTTTNNNNMNTGVIIDINGRRTRPKPPYYEGDSEELKSIRREIAALLKREVEELGRISRNTGIARGLKGQNERSSSKEVIEG